MIDGYFDQLGDVYTPNTTTGRYTTLVKSGLLCNLGHLVLIGVSQFERAETADLRNLRYEAGYDMPETAQVKIDGVYWQIREGTIESPRNMDGIEEYSRADVVRQKV